MTSPNIRKALHRAQDMIFYDKKFPKEHVERTVIALERIALDGDIPWNYPQDVLYAYDIIITELYNNFGVSYQFEDLERIVAKLSERHKVFSKLLKTKGMQYDVVMNRFFPADDKVWEQLIKVYHNLSPFHITYS